MIDTIPKQSAERETDQSLFPISNKEEKGREDENPLSLLDASITIFGIILAIITISLPAISVLLERPLPQNKGAEINQFLKKDGY